jgi:uncharacterized UBP type Zn finger protein
MAPGLHDEVVGSTTSSSNGSAPPCEHVASLPSVVPQSSTCCECQAQDAAWARLLLCLTCGWVACSDDSPLRHALAHYEETDHPVTSELASGRVRRWCYVHRRSV